MERGGVVACPERGGVQGRDVRPRRRSPEGTDPGRRRTEGPWLSRHHPPPSTARRPGRGLKAGLPFPRALARVHPVAGRYVVRPARRKDGPGFLRLVVELARFERLPPPTGAAQRQLLRDAFDRRPQFELFLAEHRPKERGSHPETVAYAVVLRTYSTFLAKPTLYLEDIYVTPTHRRKGLGDRILRYLARLTRRRGWGRIEGVVLVWNRPARSFYRRLGAVEKRDWILFRFDPRAVAGLDR